MIKPIHLYICIIMFLLVDNVNSTTQNPTHKYNKRGKFIINLIATNAAGSNAQMSTVRVIGYDQIYG